MSADNSWRNTNIHFSLLFIDSDFYVSPVFAHFVQRRKPQVQQVSIDLCEHVCIEFRNIWMINDLILKTSSREPECGSCIRCMMQCMMYLLYDTMYDVFDWIRGNYFARSVI